jgi:hypothetical protein
MRQLLYVFGEKKMDCATESKFKDVPLELHEYTLHPRHGQKVLRKISSCIGTSLVGRKIYVH